MQQQSYQHQKHLAQQQLEVLNGSLHDVLTTLGGVTRILAQQARIERGLLPFGPKVAATTGSLAAKRLRWEQDLALRHLSRYLGRYTEALQIDAIWLLNAAGDCIASSNAGQPGSFVGSNYSDRHYFRDIQGSESRLGQQYAVGRISRVPGLYVAHPVIVNRQFVGAVVTKTDIVARSRWTRNENVFVADANGAIVLAQDKSLEFRFLPNRLGPSLDKPALALEYRNTSFEPLDIAPWGNLGLQDLVRLDNRPTPFLLLDGSRRSDSFSIHLLHPMPEIRQLESQRYALFTLLALAGDLLLLALAALTLYLKSLVREREAALQAKQELEALVERRTAELQVAKEAAEQSSRAKATFLANMSHEIRTPLNAINGLTLLTLKTGLLPRQQDYLRKIQTSSQHLLGVINDILDFSKIESGKLGIEQTEFELDAVLDHIADLFGERAAAKGLELLIEVAEEVPRYLTGDPLRLEQVLINYTNNALKFTEHGQIEIRVGVIERDASGLLLHVAVRDSGIGLDETLRGKLFQSFQQADPSTTRQYGGTGLGLAISKRLAELMGGEVGVASRLGQGATFWFTARLGLGATAPVLPIPAAWQHLRVLVVDDQESAGQLTATLLERLGLEVSQQRSGSAALAALQDAEQQGQPYRLVLLDWQMPAPDGIETARRIAALGLSQRPDCVLLSGQFPDDWAEIAPAAGLIDRLDKPVRPKALFELLQRVLSPADSPHPVRADAAATHDLQRLAGARALLVEDNPLNQEVAMAFLHELGLEVELAADGALALAMVQQQRYDIVLMDMQMPVLDGLMATRAIRQLPGMADLPIVAMTANAMAGDREVCLEAGMNDHIAKPIDPGLLQAKLLQWLRPDRARMTARQAEKIAPAAAPEQSLGAIEGLDLTLGLAQAGGRPALYRSLLQQFVADQSEAIVRIEGAIQAQRWEEAIRATHTLKGVSAQIGALALREQAARLEQALQAHAPGAPNETGERLPALLAAVAEPLARLVQAISDGLARQRRPETGPAFDASRWSALRARLLALLEADDASCVQLFEDNEALVRTALGPAFAPLAEAMRHFEFQQALQALRQTG
jgi:two-component system sensor histidine kinase/response regulator